MCADWFFASHEPGLPIYNPLAGEHFNQGAVGDADWEPGQSLVRECIQNSLDAHVEGEQVTVFFCVIRPGSLTTQMASSWFSSLWPHLRSSDCKISNLPPAPYADQFIVVEDFGTRGLEGDVSQGGLADAGKSNDFFSFFRAEGLSGKTANSGGSWGVGKSVYNRCSWNNTFLAVSARRLEGNTVLIGQSLLWHHKVGSNEYQAVGQFGVPDQVHERLIIPADGQDLLGKAVRDFGIRRRLAVNGAQVDENFATSCYVSTCA